MSAVVPANALDFLGLFAGRADQASAEVLAPHAWRERAEDLAAFLAAHETCLPDAASFATLLNIGGALWAMSEQVA